MNTFKLRAIGTIHSQIKSKEHAPRQGAEGAPEAWIEIDTDFAEAVTGITSESEIILLTWLHHSNRNVLQVHPRNISENPLAGVFATRSPDRPNPIGLHRVQVLEVAEATRLKVSPLEAIDGTQIIDIKNALEII